MRRGVRAIDSSQRRRSRRGMAIVFFTIATAMLLGFIGLAIDVGHLQWVQQRAQTAADSAVYAAMLKLKSGGSAADARAAALADATLNGFTNGTDGVTVTVNNPPASGSLAGNSGAVEAIVRRTGSNFFLGFVGHSSSAVSARAAAKVGSGGGCIYALNASASRAFQISGSNSTYVQCGVNVASSSSSAFYMDGSGTLYIGSSATVGVVGDWQLTGQTAVRETPSGVLKPPVRVSSVTDPLSGIAAPSMSGLVVRGTSQRYYDMNARPTNNRMSPGIYCGGLRVGNTGGQTFMMDPGVYVMAGGGFGFGSQAKISGTGVTIYNTTGAASGVPGCAAAFSPFNVDGQATLNLSAPTSGSLEGILFFQDRNVTNATENQFVGGSASRINGTIYLKNSPVVFSGNNITGGYIIIVADKIRISGNSTVNADYSSLSSGSPVKGRSVLAE